MKVVAFNLASARHTKIKKSKLSLFFVGLGLLHSGLCLAFDDNQDPWTLGQTVAILGSVPSDQDYQNLILESSDLAKAIAADSRISTSADLIKVMATELPDAVHTKGYLSVNFVFGLKSTSIKDVSACTIRVTAKIERYYYYSGAKKIWLTEIFKPTVSECE